MLKVGFPVVFAVVVAFAFAVRPVLACPKDGGKCPHAEAAGQCPHAEAGKACDCKDGKHCKSGKDGKECACGKDGKDCACGKDGKECACGKDGKECACGKDRKECGCKGDGSCGKHGAKAAIPADMIGKEATCPVMGEKFKISEKTQTSEFEGKTYYFCCAGCKPKFDKEPAKYVKK